MKKVFQEIICAEHGDCARAAIASLLGLELTEVPDLNGHDPHDCQFANIRRFMASQGHPDVGIISIQPTEPVEAFKAILEFDGGVDGYFYASVPSKTFAGCSHAVIIDADMNVVHDPNPNGLALISKPEDIFQVMVITKFYIDANSIPHRRGM